MARDPDKINRWLTLEAVEAAIPAMAAMGAAEVARGAKPSSQTAVGFVEAYRYATGDPKRMATLQATGSSSWADRRRQFIARHLAQMRRRDTHRTGFKPDGTPTKRLLSFLAWAYLPPESKQAAQAWYKAGSPVHVSSRKNPMKAEKWGRDYTVFSWRRNPDEDLPGQVALFTPQALTGLLVEHFASGSNHPGEIRGFAALGKPVGVAAAALRTRNDGSYAWSVLCGQDCEKALIEAAKAGVPVFVDSGAFSEVEFPDDGPPRTRLAIPHAEWVKRLDLYERIIDAVGKENAYLVNVVAPDKVADQATTLARMKKYRPIIQRLARKGASILVPLQKGGMSLSQFHDAAQTALGIRKWAPRFIPSLPMKKDATTPADVQQYLKERRPHRIHLLGVGPKNEKAGVIAAAIRAGSPTTTVQADSVLLRAVVGRKGGVKPLTKAQDVMRGEALYGRWGTYPEHWQDREGVPLLDYTDAIAAPADWTSQSQRKRIAKEAGLPPAWKKRFVLDPDETLQEDYQGDPLYMDAAMDAALSAAWGRSQHQAETAQVKQEAVERVFLGSGPVSVYRNRTPARRAALQRGQKLPVGPAASALARRLGRYPAGSAHRILLRGEAAVVPDLSRMGWLKVTAKLTQGQPWTGYDVRTTPKLTKAVGATQRAREDYREEFQQVGMFRRNQQEGFGFKLPSPTAPEPKQASRVLDVAEENWLAHFGPKGAPRPGQKGYKAPPKTPAGAWGPQGAPVLGMGTSPYTVANTLIDQAKAIYDDHETSVLYGGLTRDEGDWISAEMADYYDSDEYEEEYGGDSFLLDMLRVPYRNGAGKALSDSDRRWLAKTALDYITLTRGGTPGDAPSTVIDPGKSRKGPAKPKYADKDRALPLWAAKAILGDLLASHTPGYDTSLRLVNVDKDTAKWFIKEHHSALPNLNPRGLMYALGVEKGDRLVAVATAGTPTGAWRTVDDVAGRRWINPFNIVELTRVASDGSVKGASSKLVARLLKLVEASKRGDTEDPALFITYQLSHEDGTSYKGLKDLGLRPVEYRKGGKPSGARKGGVVEDTALAQVDKIRWEMSPTPGVALPAKWGLLQKAPPQIPMAIPPR